MKTGKIFGGNYLKAEDLPAGRNVPVTISEVQIKDFDDGRKIIIHFEGKDKALVCNKTNASIISEVLGKDDTDFWVGGRVQLTIKKVEFQGSLVPAIRVVLEDKPAQRRPVPVARQEAARADEEPQTGGEEGADREIPF